MDLLNYKLQLCWSSPAARTWVLKPENLDEFEVLLVSGRFILVRCTLGSMGLEMLLPWTVEAEFGISCSFPLHATMVELFKDHGISLGEVVTLFGRKKQAKRWKSNSKVATTRQPKCDICRDTGHNAIICKLVIGGYGLMLDDDTFFLRQMMYDSG
ncbi:hypothetical protein DM860_011187 [Cuscuta australis]|uniref:Uncharacterized protein n=1 Tax=Cuscuta australis TaxID=267555 RepID=A0A328DED8_9ASTE|nr:hypothetical protein DM860_011187 [Cuscuta australis]